jgi:hypothetical protein
MKSPRAYRQTMNRKIDERVLRPRLVDEIEWGFRRTTELRKAGLLRHLAHACLAGLGT